MKTLLRNINKMLNEEKASKEIIQLINTIYKDYNDSYRNCLSNIERIINGNQKLGEELNNIAVYMKRDYEEDVESTKEIEEISFCDKKDKMLEHIESLIINLVDQRNNVNKPNGILKPILDVDETETEESQEMKTIQRNINNDNINTEFCKGVTESILSEIDSSKKSLISKLSSIRKQVDIDYAINKFVSEVGFIEDRIKLDFNNQIQTIIKAQDIEIANKIYSLYSKYIEESERIGESSQRKKFLEGLHVKVDDIQAIQKVEKQNALVEEKKNNPLGENVIE